MQYVHGQMRFFADSNKKDFAKNRYDLSSNPCNKFLKWGTDKKYALMKCARLSSPYTALKLNI